MLLRGRDNAAICIEPDSAQCRVYPPVCKSNEDRTRVVDPGEFHGVSGEDGYFLPEFKGVGEHTDSSVAKGEFGRLVYVGHAKKQIVCRPFWQTTRPDFSPATPIV
jgi:hypothetical protein